MLITSWKRRLAALAVPLVFAALALALPTGNVDADVGNVSWPTPSISFHRTGTDWNSVSSSIISGILLADNEWRNDTLWDPTIITGSSNNDLTWGQVPPRVNGSWQNGCAPTSVELAVTCRDSFGTTILEADTRFNPDPNNFTWNSARAQGVATHELGHGGGLSHSFARCGSTDPFRLTMCESATAGNASVWSTLEGKDVSDANTNYGPNF